MAYLGKTPSQAVRSRYYYTATGGETSLSGADDNSNVLTFTDGNYVDVSLNGVALVAGTDYNTTTTNTIGGLTALVASDVVEVIVYDTFSVFGGNMAADLNFKDNVKANFGTGNDLQIFHDGSNSIIRDAGTGSLKFQYGTSDGVVFDSSGKVGIGTTSPASLLHLESDTPVTTLRDTSAYSAGTGPYIQFQGLDSGSTNRVFGQIYGLSNGSNSGELAFYTRNSGSTGERLRITSAGNVGIGTSSPSHKTEIVSSSDADLLQIQSTASANNTLLRLGISGNDAIINGSGGSTGNLAFKTYGTERMRIDSSGNLLVGTTDSQLFDNTSGSGLCYRPSLSLDIARESTSSTSTAILLNNTGVDSRYITFRKDGTDVGSIGVLTDRIYLAGANEGIAIDDDLNALIPSEETGAARDNASDLGSSGARWRNLYLSGGVYLGGTGAANYLDDYEEGTWTPAIYYQNADDQTNSSNVAQSGVYTKVGNLVIATCYLKWSATDSRANDNIGVNGFPFTPMSPSPDSETRWNTPVFLGGTSYPQGDSQVMAVMYGGGSLATFITANNSSNLGDELGQNTNMEAKFTITYHVNT